MRLGEGLDVCAEGNEGACCGGLGARCRSFGVSGGYGCGGAGGEWFGGGGC